MGILAEPAALVRSLNLPNGFSVCELGDQWVNFTHPRVVASDWYETFGCGVYDAIDGNGRGTLVFDLNNPLPIEFTNQYDLVTDFGTGEHIFDQAQVWKTLHRLTKPGGIIVVDRPSTGYGLHCFYLVNPGMFTDIVQANGYEPVHLSEHKTENGSLLLAAMRKMTDAPFVVPQQGRYAQRMVLPAA